MSALALCLKEMGEMVIGSDKEDYYFTEENLNRERIPIFKFNKNNVLVECKFIKGNNGYEIRNGIGQLIEYLLEGEWNVGILLCFDKTGYKELNDRDKWFIKKFSMKDCCDENLKNVAVAIFFIYQGNNGLEIKSYNVDEL